MSNYLIREIQLHELGILEDMLYEAIFQPDENNLLPREVIKQPKIGVYIDNWGKPDDLCLVADVDGKIIGAVWTRILAGNIKGYGNIDDQTPEFAISLVKEYRGKGIGTVLMKMMIEKLKERGYKQASLSVAKDNYALKMYQNVGFEIFAEQEQDYLMLLDLN
ncbi:Acetyltransferase GNAT [Desulfitobacterium hafniense]|uniref:Acetyltransferase GNAT n=1 Tax=Desulfitobacterium hafniense TaxID=49338 RepID=A0A098B280_DESHA|nr:GNAT family N-acetyltransferase [Desulfitobacterium hafniense]CDX02948.1 Acetyltransferase GNAT [Desulfitobacterium hafniense]